MVIMRLLRVQSPMPCVKTMSFPKFPAGPIDTVQVPVSKSYNANVISVTHWGEGEGCHIADDIQMYFREWKSSAFNQIVTGLCSKIPMNHSPALVPKMVVPHTSHGFISKSIYVSLGLNGLWSFNQTLSSL